MISDAQRRRVAEYNAQRERYLSLRSRGLDQEVPLERKPLTLAHPLYAAVVVTPFVILALTGVLDILGIVTAHPVWSAMSFWLIPVGILGGVAALVPGFIDWLTIPSESRARGIGLWYVVGDLVVIALFMQGWLLRRGAGDEPGTAAVLLSMTGAGLALLTGWLGGEFIDRLTVYTTGRQQPAGYVPRTLRMYRADDLDENEESGRAARA